jgi:hypothetical protein
MRGRSVLVLLGCFLLSTCALAGWRILEFERAPCPRFGHSLVNVGGRILLFGGAGERHSPQDLFNDLWEWKGGYEWEEITPVTPPPPARKGHAAVGFRGKMYVFFGMTEEDGQPRFLNDVWVYDPAANTWSQIPVSGTWPPARADHTATSCAGRILILGGVGDEGQLRDLWAFDPTSGTWERRADFPGGPIYGAALFPYGNYFFAYTGEPEGGLWIYSVEKDSWFYKHTEGAPPPRECFGWTPWDDGLLICGGFSKLGNLLADCWRLILEAGLVWENIMSLPFGLGCPVLAPMEGEGTGTVLFGGITESGFSGETLVYEP